MTEPDALKFREPSEREVAEASARLLEVARKLAEKFGPTDAHGLIASVLMRAIADHEGFAGAADRLAFWAGIARMAAGKSERDDDLAADRGLN